jgi:hypothetical protein
MASATRKAFEFLYVHRGPTDLWDLETSKYEGDAGEGEPLGARLGPHDHGQEWYRVVIELGPDEDDMEVAKYRAKACAEAELRRLHPGHHPVPPS